MNLKNLIKNNAFLYCQQKVARPGSNIYYSTLYTEPLQKIIIITLRALQQELAEIIWECHEPQLALTKYQWWQTELQRLETQEATHPITQTLALLAPDFSLDITAWQTIVNTHMHDVNIGTYETESVLLNFYQQTAGLCEKQFLSIYACNNQNKKVEISLEKFGIFIAIVNNLNQLRQHMQQGHTYIAGETLIKHHTNLQQLSTLKLNYNIQQLFKDLTEQPLQIYQDAHALISKHERKAMLPTLILAKLYFKLLQEIIAANYPMLTQQLDLTPLRKWWTAWRMA